MEAENRTHSKNSVSATCQSCKKDFIIEPEDFKFYEKIKVPPPTFCPGCRFQRRLVWLKGIKLYKQKCALCKKDGLSMYAPDSLHKIYCHDCWWSDKWNPMDYAKEYNFTRPFFEQFIELFRESPLRAQPIDAITRDLSPYTNFAGWCKNCYLIFYSEGCEDTAYGFFLKKNKKTYDSSMTWECENVFDVTNGLKSYNIFTGQGNIINCLDCYFIKDCKNCINCFGSVNLRNKSYVFFNKQLTREAYIKKTKDIDLGSYKVYEKMRKKVYEFWKSKIPRPFYDDFSTNVTGNYILQSKNCRECYDVGYAEDSKFLMLIKAGIVKNSYDYMDGWTAAELMYECVTVGAQTNNIRFSQDGGHGLHTADYTILCFGGSDLFGCIGLRNRKYCILNKQYTKREFFELREKIIKQMKEIPFIDKTGLVYKYGEFFPISMSPHAYNDTLAHLFFPKKKEIVIKEGLSWIDQDSKEYSITMQNKDIPDNIKNINENIVEKVIQCNTCIRGFKIIHQEIQFLKQHNIPLPRQCPFCRIENKVKRWVWQMTLNDRTCNKCKITFRTHYNKKEAPKIYCKKCYQQEVY